MNEQKQLFFQTLVTKFKNSFERTSVKDFSIKSYGRGGVAWIKIKVKDAQIKIRTDKSAKVFEFPVEAWKHVKDIMTLPRSRFLLIPEACVLATVYRGISKIASFGWFDLDWLDAPINFIPKDQVGIIYTPFYPLVCVANQARRPVEISGFEKPRSSGEYCWVVKVKDKHVNATFTLERRGDVDQFSIKSDKPSWGSVRSEFVAQYDTQNLKGTKVPDFGALFCNLAEWVYLANESVNMMIELKFRTFAPDHMNVKLVDQVRRLLDVQSFIYQNDASDMENIWLFNACLLSDFSKNFFDNAIKYWAWKGELKNFLFSNLEEAKSAHDIAVKYNLEHLLEMVHNDSKIGRDIMAYKCDTNDPVIKEVIQKLTDSGFEVGVYHDFLSLRW